MKKLITFGDSWVWGVGSGFTKGMTKDEYDAIKEDPAIAGKNCFRRLLCEEHDMENINFSEPASSNQRQFRLASEYFLKEGNIEKDSVVLWGLTSVYRLEYYDSVRNTFKNTFLSDGEDTISKLVAMKMFDEKIETERLFYQIRLFNSFFAQQGVKNYWFNIFNDHKFTGTVDNLLFDGSSLLSEITNDKQPNDKYHLSNWHDTDRKIVKALESGMVNPFTKHPTKDTHQKIADLFGKTVNFKTGDLI